MLNVRIVAAGFNAHPILTRLFLHEGSRFLATLRTQFAAGTREPNDQFGEVSETAQDSGAIAQRLLIGYRLLLK